MGKIAVRNPITKEPLPLIIERGEVKAVVMDIEQFKAISKLLETMEDEDIREAAQLAKLPMFRNAVEEGLEAIKDKKTRPWRVALADRSAELTAKPLRYSSQNPSTDVCAN